MIPQNFADAFERVKELVSNFSQNEERYLSPGYSEAQARLDVRAFGLIWEQDGKGYEVEFVTLDGHTAAVATLDASKVRPVTRRGIGAFLLLLTTNLRRSDSRKNLRGRNTRP